MTTGAATLLGDINGITIQAALASAPAAGDDLIIGNQGADNLYGGPGEDTFLPGFDGANDTVTGGDGFDTILVEGTSGNDRIDVRQENPTSLLYEISGINGGDGVVGGTGTETDTLVLVPGAPVTATGSTVEEARIAAGAGDDTIRVAHADILVDNVDTPLVDENFEVFSLRFTVGGGPAGS